MSDAERTVLRVMSVDDGGRNTVTIEIEETPVEDLPEGKPSTVPLLPNDDAYKALDRCPHPGLVKAAGERLFGSLTSDKRVRMALQSVLYPPDSATAYPIYFRIDDPLIESLPWEALYESRKRFLTINDRWPIGRMPVSRKRESQAKRTIWPKLRVVAVVAAAGRTTDGAGEMRALWKALKDASCEVLVLTSESEVLDAVEQEGSPCLSAGYVGNSSRELLGRIGAFRPNLVHFYCHGTADGRPELEVETLEDRTLGKVQGSIRLNEMDLLPLCGSDSVWAVTLNCCEGARGSARACSLASSLSARGLPVVVAMRESIHIHDAHLFAEAFYSELLREFERLFALYPLGQPVRVDDLLGDRALRCARTSLPRPAIDRVADPGLRERCLQHPEGSAREWTYPVLYLNRGGLLLLPKSEASALTSEEIARLQEKLDAYKQQREDWVRDRAAPSVIEGLDAEIRRIEQRLYPPLASPTDPPQP